MTDVREKAKRLKEKGNEAFKKRLYSTAIREYTDSLELYADPVVFSNRAQTELNQSMWVLAQMDCTEALKLDPSRELTSKTFYRRAQAFRKMGLFELALKDMEKCVEIENNANNQTKRDELIGKKNAQSVSVCPVQRTECMQSTEPLKEVAISFDKSLFPTETPKEIVKERRPRPQVDRLPDPPSNYQEFSATIAFLSKDPTLLAEYFLQIPVTSYHLFNDVFDHSDFALTFDSLAKYLQAGFEIENLYERLLMMTNIHRFDITILMMNEEERERIRILCDYLSDAEATDIKEKFSC
ncbi:unnamed protein product [Caenorhabditis sp. 36 PRJEB53466]|nr:unnamed protein product [Caenorhabditis sp. 36 PRJEB53466]